MRPVFTGGVRSSIAAGVPTIVVLMASAADAARSAARNAERIFVAIASESRASDRRCRMAAALGAKDTAANAAIAARFGARHKCAA